MAQRKMVNLSVEETSGVDHPAHLHEGWVILKHADQAGVAEVIETLAGNTEEQEQTVSEETPTVDVAQLEADLAKANERIVELETALAAVPAVEETPVVEEASEEALIKSMPEAVREMLEKARAGEIAAREELQKAQEVARDKEFTEKVSLWKSLTINAEEFGPQLRKLADIAPELAEIIEKALAAVNAQAESANIFAELGSTVAPASGDAFGRVESLAKAKVAAGESKTVEQAMTAVIAENPELYREYLAEKRGN